MQFSQYRRAFWLSEVKLENRNTVDQKNVKKEC